MGLLDLIDVPKAVAYVQSCENLDGAYGIHPNAESHAGQVFTCVGALAIAGRLDLVDKDRLGAWLSERQVEKGGFNGRPEKLEDSCYSWWVGSSLAMIDRLHWIDGKKLAAYILRCQVGRVPCPWDNIVRQLIWRRIQKLVDLQIVQGTWLMFTILILPWRD